MTSGWTPLHACRKAAEVLWRWAVGSLAAATLTLIMLGAAQAVEPNEVLADPALEARARAISAGLRCLVCQNQSIDDSSAPLARDLRLLVRERLSAGDTDEAVRSYLVARYGDFVLLSPPFNTGTLLLWFGPLLLLAAGIVLAGRQLARSTSAAKVVDLASPPPLSPDETKRLEQIMKS